MAIGSPSESESSTTGPDLTLMDFRNGLTAEAEPDSTVTTVRHRYGTDAPSLASIRSLIGPLSERWP